MKPYLSTFALLVLVLVPSEFVMGQRRAVVRSRVVVHRPVQRAPLVVHRGYPLRRVLPTTVVVHPARRVVTVGAPLVYLPAQVWTRTVVAMPAGDRLVWQDSEQIEREEDWVDTNFGIDSSGDALVLDINSIAQLNFAEVTFANGNVQVVDFDEQTHKTGTYRLLNFGNVRHVKTVRILAKSDSDQTKLALYLSK